MASPASVDEVRARLDLVEVVSGYLTLKRAGRELRGSCPFHSERTPSFYVNPEKQLWNCHGCHLGGDVFKFVELIEHTDFRGALEELAKRVGVDLTPPEQESAAERRRRRFRESSLRLNQLAADFYHEVLLNHRAGAPGRHFAEERGLGEEDVDRFHLGYAPEGSRRDNLVRYLTKRGADAEEIAASGLGRSERGEMVDFLRRRLAIPIRDERGRWVGFGGRSLGPDQPKYLNTRSTAVFDKSRLLFGLDLAREAVSRERRAVLMEGYMDVIGAHRAGVGTAVSTSGTSLTELQARLLRRYADEVVVCFDPDPAGQRAAQAAVELLGRAGFNCRLAMLPSGQDPDDLSRGDPEGLRRLVSEAPPAWEVLMDEALGDASSQSGGPRQEALRRAMGVLGRIPEASIRELYADRVGRRLGIAPSRILEDVERGGRREPTQTVGLESQAEGKSPMGASAHLLGLLWARPQLVSEVRDRYQLNRDDFPDPQDGSLYDALGDSLPERPVPEALSPELGDRLGRLAELELPELDDDEDGVRVRRAVEDCVRSIRIEVAEQAVAEVQSRLGGQAHHREGEAPALVAELDRLHQRIDALRRGGGLGA